MIRSSKKLALMSLLKVIEHNTRSVTGQNLRSILLKAKVHQVQSLKPTDVNFKYCDIPDEEAFRVYLINDIIEVRNGEVEFPGLSKDELDDIMQHRVSELFL